MEDSRKSPRCTIHWRCAIAIEEQGRRETIQSRTNDVSMTGVAIICHRNIPPPKAVTVYLLIDPGDESRPQVIVEAQGEIRNNVLSGQQGGFRLGIQFTNFARDGKQILQKNLPREMIQSARVVTATAPTPAADVGSAVAEAPAAEAMPAEEAAPAAELAPPTDETSIQADAPASAAGPEQA